jgi:hypothetical protein
MADTIYLSPSVVSLLTPECLALLVGLQIEVVDEDLRQESAGGVTYFGKYRTWKAEPKPRIRKVNPTTAAETLLFEDEYAIDLAAGEVTLDAVTTDIVRADYFFSPLNDTLIERLMEHSVQEISNLLGRVIDPLNIPEQYHVTICKRLYTNVLKALQVEYHDFYSISISGVSISKDNVPKNTDLIIKQNETQVMEEINALRLWNTTQRFE